jgi:Tol biopolymer transport system component
MALVPGTRLGAYEIVAPIGAGGMGEVYRGRDGRLNREVAIKVLPERLGADRAALERFGREAQAVAALSHPNILAIHDFGVADGLAYAVTELLDGESLRAKLAGGALPTRKAVEVGLQIVHGIAAAHQKGVIHRDLKPENIFITSDGRVKILDFGLAKVAGGAAGDEGTLRTQSGLGTSPGTVMGTVGYMSPEQVRGQPADHRTDIFSFGVVLYEMLSGVRAFRGDSGVETMSAILKDDPPELGASGTQVPMALERIVRRCLEKNAAERFHSAHDLGLALETLSGVSGSGSAAFMPAAGLAPAHPRWRPWLVWSLALAALPLAGAAFLAGRQLGRPAEAEPARFQRLTFRRGEIHSARFAGDGKTIVYSATWGDEPRRLYSTQEGSPDSLALAYPAADIAAVSSTGELALIQDRRSLLGYSRVGTLARASLSGGAARAVLEGVQDADWLPDGSGLAVARHVEARYRLEFPAGKPVYDTAGYISDVRVSPDGELCAFADHPILGDDRGTIAVVDRTGRKRTLSSDFSSVQGVAWARGGKEVWFTASDQGNARALFAWTLDGTARIVTRAPGSLHLADVGADGSVLLWQEDTRNGIQGRVPGDVTDRELSWLDWSTLPRLSADGKTLLFTEQGDGGGAEYSVFLRPTHGGAAVRLGTGAGSDLSPDGKWVLTLRLNPAPPQHMLLPTGAGEPRELPRDTLTHGLGWFVRDGTHMAFWGYASGAKGRVYLQDLAGGAPQPITPEGVLGVPSRDGKDVAFEGRLYAAGDTQGRAIAGVEPEDRIEAWSADGKSLFVRRMLEDGAQRVLRLDLATGRRTLLHDIARIPRAEPRAWFTITPDASAYAFAYGTAEADLYRVTGLR